MRRVVVIGSVVSLALAGCFGGGEKTASEPQQATTPEASTVTPVVPPTPTERVLQAIRKCEVKSIVFAHGNLTFVTYRDGTKARSTRLDQKALMNAAYRVSSEDDCRILIGIE